MGVGQFGYVYRATWRQSRGSSSSRNSNCFDETGILERADVETMTAAHNTEHGCPQQHPSVEFVAIKAVCEKMAGNSLDVGDEGVDEMDLDSLCHELDIQSQ